MLRAVLASLLVLASCSPPAPRAERDAPAPTRASNKERLRALRGLERAVRASYDATVAPPWVDVSGADPYRLVAAGRGFLGLLRGSRALVRLDAELHEVARLELQERPTALCVSERGDAW